VYDENSKYLKFYSNVFSHTMFCMRNVQIHTPSCEIELPRFETSRFQLFAGLPIKIYDQN